MMRRNQNDRLKASVDEADPHRSAAGLPRVPAALIRVLLPYAERDEVLGDLAAEHEKRAESAGRLAAAAWLWRQVLVSAPALARRGWWRGWSGYQPRSDWVRPGGAMFESWAMDIAYTLRRLRRQRTYAALTVLTLSLGVAGTAAVYAVAQRLLWEPLPIPADEEVVLFWRGGSWTPQEFVYLRPRIEGFESVAAFWRTDVTFRRGDAPARAVDAISTSAELFQVLGVSPAIGPGFQPGDDVPGSDPVAVLSHSVWQELGGDPSIIGQRIEFSGQAHTVVGVMPAGFWFPDPAVGVWRSASLHPESEMAN